MSIEDYALELGVDTKTVISKLKELGFKYNNDKDILDDEAIIMLDNELTSEKENNLTEELASKFELEDRAEEAALAYNIELDEEVKVKEKIKKKDSNKQSNDDLSQKKKNIYKNKSKLQSNKEEVLSNVVLYKEGMSVSDLATAIGVSASDVVKKLIGMGLMISSSQAISFDDASVVVLEYNKELVKEKFYDGIIFHRVISDFMIQTGDPTGTGMGGSEKEIKGEFKINGVENNLSHVRGVLSMARRGSNPETEDTMNSASSQFFIVHKDSDFLDGNYAAFGKLLNGYDILDKIATTTTDQNDKPLDDIKMNGIRFVTLYEE